MFNIGIYEIMESHNRTNSNCDISTKDDNATIFEMGTHKSALLSTICLFKTYIMPYMREMYENTDYS